MFDVFGWFSSCTFKMKIAFQQLWEEKLDWDDVVPDDICKLWVLWRRKLGVLPNKQIPHCLISKDSQVLSTQLHGFSDASERAYSAVVYIRIECADGSVQVPLVSSKTKAAQSKKQQFRDWSFVELHVGYLLNSSTTLVLQSSCLHPTFTIGLTASLCRAGSQVTHAVWNPLWEIELLIFLSVQVRIFGGTLVEHRIQPTAPPEDCSHQNWWITSYGGKVQLGWSYHCHFGLNNLMFSKWLFLKKKGKCRYTQHPTTKCSLWFQ